MVCTIWLSFSAKNVISSRLCRNNQWICLFLFFFTSLPMNFYAGFSSFFLFESKELRPLSSNRILNYDWMYYLDILPLMCMSMTVNVNEWVNAREMCEVWVLCVDWLVHTLATTNTVYYLLLAILWYNVDKRCRLTSFLLEWRTVNNFFLEFMM